MKKITLLLFCGLLCTANLNAQSGTDGNITWSIANDTLTISGIGAMPDYTTVVQWNVAVPTAPWGAHQNSFRVVVIEDGVTTIGICAFITMSRITSVIIPNSVTIIKRSAFASSGLTSVIIPDSVTMIENGAFHSCSSLTSAIIGNSVRTIDQFAFQNSGLISVTIPKSVTSLHGYYIFDGCTKLTSIDVATDNPNFSSEDGVLFNKNKTTLIQYPGGKQGIYTIPNSVATIGLASFRDYTGTSIIIPNSVKTISRQAFQNSA